MNITIGLALQTLGDHLTTRVGHDKTMCQNICKLPCSQEIVVCTYMNIFYTYIAGYYACVSKSNSVREYILYIAGYYACVSKSNPVHN